MVQRTWCLSSNAASERPRRERHARLIVDDVLRRGLRGGTTSAPTGSGRGPNEECGAMGH